MLSSGMKKEKGMRKKAKSMKLVTMPLTWCGYIRWRSGKRRRWGRWEKREERREMIERDRQVGNISLFHIYHSLITLIKN